MKGDESTPQSASGLSAPVVADDEESRDGSSDQVVSTTGEHAADDDVGDYTSESASDVEPLQGSGN